MALLSSKFVQKFWFVMYFFKTLLALPYPMLKCICNLVAIPFHSTFYSLSNVEKQSLYYKHLGILIYELAVACGTVSRKLLQTLATRGDMFPAVISNELRKICHSVEEMPSAEVRAILESAYPKDKNPFLSFDYKPIASGCIAQVHCATISKSAILKNQKRFSDEAETNITTTANNIANSDLAEPVTVAVKIYRKNILRCVDYDFTILLIATRLVQFYLRERIRVRQWVTYYIYRLLLQSFSVKILQWNWEQANEEWANYASQIEESVGRQKDVLRLIYKLKSEFLLQAKASNEIKNMQEFAQEYEHYRDTITWPELYLKQCRPQQGVIVMEYLQGFTLQCKESIAKLSKGDQDFVYNQLLQFGLASLFLRKVSHADLHAGNCMFLPECKKLGIIDFGIVTRKTNVQADNLLQMHEAMNSKQWPETVVKLFDIVTVKRNQKDELPTSCRSSHQLTLLWMELYHGLRDHCLCKSKSTTRYFIQMCNVLDRYGFELDPDVSGLNLNLLSLEATMQTIRSDVQFIQVVSQHLGFDFQEESDTELKQQEPQQLIDTSDKKDTCRSAIHLQAAETIFACKDSYHTSLLQQLRCNTYGELIPQSSIDDDSLVPPYSLNKRFIAALHKKATDYFNTLK